mgnify:CR=1 FL=1
MKMFESAEALDTMPKLRRATAHLAKTLLKGANVQLLNAPSNDLDVEKLRALEDAPLEFPG